MRQIIILSLFVVMLLVGISCESTHVEQQDTYTYEPLENTPVITLDSTSTTSVVAYQDAIVFSIFYQDGNGDIGSIDPDKYAIELVDNRDPAYLIFFYQLSPQAPVGADIALQGTLHIVLDHSILLNPDNASEETTFSIRLRDDNDNWSNSITSPTITIYK